MAGGRAKGQEVQLILLLNGNPLDAIQAIRDSDITWKTEILSEGYLGETTERKDSIFKGIEGKLSFHIETIQVFTLITFAIDKAARRLPGLKCNIKQTINLPDGRRPRIVIPDVEFGPLPLSFGGRDDYGEISVDYAAAQANIITA